MRRQFATFLLLSSVVGPVGASISLQDDILQSLQLPLENRLQSLKSHGEDIYPAIERLAFDRSQSLEIRWRALTAFGHLNPDKAARALQRAAKSSEWFMRNASLIAMEHGPRDKALSTAQTLLDDPALIVRTAAVQSIVRWEGREKIQILWKKLYSPENFRNGKSLWIRKYIAQALLKLTDPQKIDQLQTLLRDKDPAIQALATSHLASRDH